MENSANLRDNEVNGVLEYLFIHHINGNPVSLDDMARATKLPKNRLLKAIDHLSTKEMLNYVLNSRSKDANEYIDRMNNTAARNFARAYHKSE